MNTHSQNFQSDAPEQNDYLLTVPEAAEFLQLSPGTIYHLISERRIPVIKISSRCVRFSRQAVLLWIEDLSESVESFSRPNS
jgi:excisionase family DNA binding protein